MNKKEITSIDQGFLKNVSEVLEKARKNAKTAVNLSMIWLFNNESEADAAVLHGLFARSNQSDTV